MQLSIRQKLYMIIPRILTNKLLEAATEYPVVALVGPRQSGKTTLAQGSFVKHRYVSLEDYDVRSIAQQDPRRFLNDYPTEAGIIIDEIQHVPSLLSYMQTIVDAEKKKGYFIVTGSQNFLVDEALTQTLAGRMAVLTLLPLSIRELSASGVLPDKFETLIYKGSYPQVYAQKISIERLYTNYIRLYVERDVRQIRSVSDLSTFAKFMRLCAGRIGQELNLTSLGSDCGITHNTARAWISLLEASYVIFLMYPFYNNFGKRLIKSPKLYFVDTGLACSLLNIETAEQVSEHYLRGNLFESLIISDFLKQQYNRERQPNIYFWRDQGQHEIDCIVDEYPRPVPIEIKSGKTVVSDFFKEFEYWNKLTDNTHLLPYLIYGGSDNQPWPQAHVMSWKSIGNLMNELKKK